MAFVMHDPQIVRSLIFFETLQNNIDKHFSLGVFLALKKAFDFVNHKILLEKLNFDDFRGIINEWFQSYLINRMQTT